MSEPTTSPLFQPAPLDLHDPLHVDALIEFHRRTFGGYRMEDPPKDPPKDPPADPPKNDPPKQDPPKDPPKDAVKLDMTQDQLDEILKKRLADQDAKHKKELERIQATAGKSELEKAQLERDQAKGQVTEVTKASAQRIAGTEAKLAAIVAGGKTERLAAIVGQADLKTAIDDEGNVDDAKVKTAIEKVLEDYPEWKADGKTPGRSGGELGSGGGGSDKPSFTRKQIEDMSPEERVKRIDEINEAMAAGRITG